MRTIPVSFKKLYFNKGVDEELTEEEKKIWENLEASIQVQNLKLDLDDPTFLKALKLYLLIKQDNIAPWEKFEKRVLQKNQQADIQAIKPTTPLIRMRTWKWTWKWIPAVMIIGIIWMTFRYFQQTDQRKPLDIIQRTGIKETDTFTLPDG